MPPPSALAAFQSGQVIQQVSPTLRSPYVLQSALTVERQLSKEHYARGHLHQYARVPRTSLDGYQRPAARHLQSRGSGQRGVSAGASRTGFHDGVDGVFTQNVLAVNVSSKVRETISLFGSYSLNRAISDFDSPTTFPANPYSLTGENGPASSDIHNYLNGG